MGLFFPVLNFGKGGGVNYEGGIFSKNLKWGDGIKMGGGFGENNVKKIDN